MHTNVHLPVLTQMHTTMCVCVCVCIIHYIYIYIYMCVCVCVCAPTHIMYVCVYNYIERFQRLKSLQALVIPHLVYGQSNKTLHQTFPMF